MKSRMCPGALHGRTVNGVCPGPVLVQSARSGGLSPILNGVDPLAELTRNLDDQIRTDAYRARGASPFQVEAVPLSANWDPGKQP